LREGFAGLVRSPTNAGVDDRLEEMGFVRWVMVSRESLAFLLRGLAAFTILILFLLTVFDLISNNWMVRVGGALALTWLLCAVGLTAATSISRERQKQTLVDLLMLPGPRRDLLRAKLIGALARGVWPAVLLVALIGTAAIGLGL